MYQNLPAATAPCLDLVGAPAGVAGGAGVLGGASVGEEVAQRAACRARAGDGGKEPVASESVSSQGRRLGCCGAASSCTAKATCLHPTAEGHAASPDMFSGLNHRLMEKAPLRAYCTGSRATRSRSLWVHSRAEPNRGSPTTPAPLAEPVCSGSGKDWSVCRLQQGQRKATCRRLLS